MNVKPFSDLTQQDLDHICTCGQIRTYPKGAVLITEGGESDHFYVIHSGRVKIFASDEDGKEIILNTLEAGDYFGELALIDDEPRSASAMTTEPSQLSVVSKSHFRACLAKNPEMAYNLIQALVRRIRGLTEIVKSLALEDVYGRVAATLLRLAKKQGNVLIIEPRPTHLEIASMVGASREMVSRIMGDLQKGGYVEVVDRRFIIHGKLPPGW